PKAAQNEPVPLSAMLTKGAVRDNLPPDDLTPLDEYVHAPDDVYQWEEIDYYNMTMIGCHTYIINFTSQTWQTPEFSTQPVWFHYLVVHVPLNFTHKDAGVMYIEGGGNDSDPPDPDSDTVILTCQIAKESGSVGALLKMIPNQPIRYFDDPEGRNKTEDESIAWTWRKYINNQSDPTVLLQFPMTKGAIRAMDTINAVVKEKDPESDVKRFMTAGGSKRGWVTWLTACIDKRVVVVSPIVLSILNFNQNLHGHYESLGGWTYVFNDYYEVNLTRELDNPSVQMMMDHIDPYSYRGRMTMPKLVFSATGDEFFMPDDSYNFFDDLKEPKYMEMMHNTNHGMIFSYLRLYKALTVYWISYLEETPKPNLTWSIERDVEGGSITLYTDTVPKEVNAYFADTMHPERRDFRWTVLNGTQPIFWNDTSELIEELDAYTYRIYMNVSDTANYRGFFINAVFEGPAVSDYDFDMTTEVNIVPPGKPFPPCVGEECYGTLV
ncbi:hypothetical protein LSH36_648g01071, partial [Paralvinella palmiformis]